MRGADMVPGMHLGTVPVACPDCQYPKMELICHAGWPHPLYKVQCLQCYHMWVVDKKMNAHYESLLEPGTDTQVVD